MVTSLLKDLFVPGTSAFFLLAATFATLLSYRKRDNGRVGRRLLTALVLTYWVLSTPISAVPLVRATTPSYEPIRSRAEARGATAIVVLGGGADTYHSRGGALQSGSREHSLRVLEAARVYGVMDRPWVIVSGSLGAEAVPESAIMRRSLNLLGVPLDRILEEPRSRSTRDHAIYIPPMLSSHGVKQFVLVTSRQHMARALRVFRVTGWDPVPSSPEFYTPRGVPFEPFLPAKAALDASTAMMYDLLGFVYYRARGWI